MDEQRIALEQMNRRLAEVLACNPQNDSYDSDLASVINEGLEVARLHLAAAEAARARGDEDTSAALVATTAACFVTTQRIFHRLAGEVGAPAEPHYADAVALVDGLTDQLGKLAALFERSLEIAPARPSASARAIGAPVFEHPVAGEIAAERLVASLNVSEVFAVAAAVTAASLGAMQGDRSPRAFLHLVADQLPNDVNPSRESGHLASNAFALHAFLAAAGRIFLAQLDTWSADGTAIGPYASILGAARR